MLGDHQLATALQVNSSFSGGFNVKDIGAAVAYQNLRRRWNWGAIVEQTPLRSGFVESFVGTSNGQAVLVERATLFRQTNRAVTGVAAYPFSRADRVEVAGGFRNLSFDEEVTTTIASFRTGEILFEDTESRSLQDPLRLGEASVALVHDTSYFGATSPVLGQRYRFEVAPTIGGLSFSGVLADYRRYVMPLPFVTIAGRVLHYGRYGGDAEDSRLMPLFLGYPTLVRGYDVGTFDAADCEEARIGLPVIPGDVTPCPAFERLLGSRLLVANLEVRFPLFRPFGVGRRMYGPIPAELAFFADGGVAWDKSIDPKLFGGDRAAVTSAGVALRVNAFGFAILQLDFVRPFDRPGKGWLWQFSLAPGF
jgi:hypothetical protein